MSTPRAERPDMAAYGVPDDLDGVLPWSWARERLQPNKNYWVVTVSADGRPHASPVWGLWADDDRFWFSCDPSAFKARNIAAHPDVVVMADDTVEMVSVEGRAEAAAVPRPVAAAWAAKYGDEVTDQSVDELAEFFSSNAAFVVTPTKAIGMIERPEDFGRRATRWVFSPAD